MPTKVKDLKNCYLAAFRVSVHGGIRYSHSEEQRKIEERREESQWKTHKVLDDRDEYKRAQNMRNNMKRSVHRLGKANELGTIVPQENEGQLDDLIQKNKDMVRAFNETARHSNIQFTALKFYISGENEVALEDMLNELRMTLGDLKRAVESADFKSIRSVVEKLKGYDMVLPDTAADYLQRAIADARKQAVQARKALEDRGQELADVQQTMETATVDFARFAVMEPGTELRDVDNELVQKMIEAQAESRFANVVLLEDDDEEDSTTESPFGEGDGPRVLMEG
jgi:hypothetical protein